MNREELDQYMTTLNNRVYEMEDRARLVWENYIGRYGPLEDGEE